MKHTLLAFTAVGFLTLASCAKDKAGAVHDVSPAVTKSNGGQPGQTSDFFARYSGPNYSQPISKDTANKMILSYLTSVGYPGVDTALRALTFDADSLRNYLANPSIVTVKFMVAHKLNYVNSGGSGVNAGLNPAAITLVLVGLNDGDEYIMNSVNRVYDNFNPCPSLCPGTSGTFIY